MDWTNHLHFEEAKVCEYYDRNKSKHFLCNSFQLGSNSQFFYILRPYPIEFWKSIVAATSPFSGHIYSPAIAYDLTFHFDHLI